MTYPLSDRLFLENGPAIQAAAVRKRLRAIAIQLTEQARLEAARTVTGTDVRLAA